MTNQNDETPPPSRQRRVAGHPHVAVRISRSGGVAGITRRWQAEAPRGDEAQWVAAIEDCPWEEAVGYESHASRADDFMWRIVAVIRHDERSITLPDEYVTGPWQHLVGVVRDASTR